MCGGTQNFSSQYSFLKARAIGKKKTVFKRDVRCRQYQREESFLVEVMRQPNFFNPVGIQTSKERLKSTVDNFHRLLSNIGAERFVIYAVFADVVAGYVVKIFFLG